MTGLVRRASWLVALMAVATGVVQSQGVDRTATDPTGGFTVDVPTGWTLAEEDGHLRARDPDQAIDVVLVGLEAESAQAGLLRAWRLTRPGPAPTATGVVRPPPEEGVEEAVCINYQAPPGRVILALGQLHQGRVYAFLLDASLDGYARRRAQVATLLSSLRILAIEREDLADATMRPFDGTVAADARAYLEATMDRMSVPGAVVAVVQDGRLAWLEAFGVKQLGRPEPMTVDTQLMIGSSGKTLTTLMIASLIDDGRLRWDTPATTLLPSFALADPALTETLELRQLVCACSGVPRHDLELLFHARVWTAEEVVASLSGIAPYTGVGEAFQYSNQMVAAGGYLAAVAGDGDERGLLPRYAAELQRRVLGPIGMRDTTLSFLAVMARKNHAIPHSEALSGERIAIPLTSERFVLAVAPAGGHWSTAPDLARYLITLLQGGVAPDGTRVVSAEGLATLWTPQVRIRDGLDYGLGWMVGSWHGLRTLSHSGNTFGFTSTLLLLPEKGLGVAVLANARATNVLNETLAMRLVSRLLGRPVDDLEKRLDFVLETRAASRAEALSRLRPGLDAEALAGHLGRFAHPQLGAIELRLVEGRLAIDTGDYRSVLARRLDRDGRVGYVAAEPPMSGLAFYLTVDAGGAPVVILDDPVEPYRFVRP